MRRKRLLAWICLALVLCCLMGMLRLHCHICTGESCVVCAQMELVRHLFASVFLCCIGLALARPRRRVCRQSSLRVCVRCVCTPVLQKVKLSN